MKRVLVLMSCFLCFQGLLAQGIQARLLTGFNAAQIDGDHLGGYNKFGLVGGASVFIPLTEEKNWFIEEEIVYSQKGSRNGKNESAFKYKIDYLESNLVFSHYPIKDNPFSIRGGLKIGYLLRAKFDEGYGDNDVKEGLNSFQTTYILGVGYDVSKKIALNAHFSRDVFSASPKQAFYNNTIRLMLAWNLSSSD